MSRILLIDDDDRFGDHLQSELEKRGYQVQYQDSAEDVPGELANGEIDLVLLDYCMPGRDGLEFLDDLQQRCLRLPVILMTGHGSSSTVIDAMKLGAYAYVSKDCKHIGELLQELEPLIVKALGIDWRGEQVRLPGDFSSDDDCGPKLLGTSETMKKVYDRIGRCVRSELPVLIRGETGTGKELVARAIRAHSARMDKPFVVVNCAAFNEERLDDELFGHELGAFPGADKLRKGSFEHAEGGTLFLDEIGDLPLLIQGKLLGTLGNHEVFRRGSNESIPVNVRLLAATRHDLEAARREGKFLDELFFRLNGMPIDLPPLRERGEDLHLLVQHFLAKVARSTNRPKTLHEGAWSKLRGYPWPGNIWELQNVIGRAALLCPGPQITAEDIEFDERPSSDGEIAGCIRQAIHAALHSGQLNLAPRLRDLLNQELLLLTLTQCGGDPKKAERILGVPLEGILHDPAGKPDASHKSEKPKARPKSFRPEALLLIQDNPEWTVEQYAEKLNCSKATLYRDPIINRALQARGGGR